MRANLVARKCRNAINPKDSEYYRQRKLNESFVWVNRIHSAQSVDKSSEICGNIWRAYSCDAFEL